MTSLARTTFHTTLAIAVAFTFTLSAHAATKLVMTDQAITDKIEDEIIWEPGVSTMRVDVSTEDGIVTLTGTVNNLLAKERAIHIAETVKGVRAVIDKVEVDPSVVRNDLELQEDIERALFTDPATDEYEIKMTANRGIITLLGTVDSYREKELATTVVKGVNGVRIIDNRIRVDYTTDRADSEMEEEIEQSLKWNTLVDDGLITVRVKDGKAFLTGRVGSAAEKTQAKLDCWVTGVTEVDLSGLEVAGWLRDDKLRGTKYVHRSEAEIRDAIKDALSQDPRVRAFRVDVEVAGRDVTLRGNVDNLKAKRAAASIARLTTGVMEVDDRLRVRPTDIFDDLEIAEEIRAAIKRDPFVERHEISVVVLDGVAYLYGQVDSEFEKGQADDVASRVNGVLTVKNHLGIDPDTPAYSYSPYWDASDFNDYYWYNHKPTHAAKTDAEIEEDIESELWWSPFVNSNDITVEVEDGVATLTGEVASLGERDTAADNARQGGARWVNNEIVLQLN